MTLQKSGDGLRLYRLGNLIVVFILPAVMVSAQASRKTAPVKDVAHKSNAAHPAKATTPPPAKPAQPVKFVEVMPAFNGDLSAYISGKLLYPDSARKQGQEGRSVVQFTVSTEGDIVDCKIVRSSGFMLLDEEALRVISGMPRWRPGRQQGEPVAVYFTMPVTFKLDD